MRRVVQFSTGNVGVYSLPAIIGRPDLELVGVHAAGPDKIGREFRSPKWARSHRYSTAAG